ncbi:MAG: hypothetical protein ACLFUA_11430 [Spirochaetales bacterium]
MTASRMTSRAVGIAILALLTVALTGCGGYYYRATIQGFVIDDETEAGINEATVRIYSDEVDDPNAEGYVAQTSTVTQGGNAGYYSSTVIWQELFGEYGQEGDTTTIWLSVTHPDYGSTVVEAEGILSEEDNLVASVRLTQTTFDLPALRGRVEDSNGAGVDGVRVVLDLPAVSGDDEPEDLVTQTATIDGNAGTFEFSPVEWSDANTSDPDGELTATLRVDDPEWGADVSGIADPVSEDYLIEQTVDLVPGEETRVVSDPIEVFRRPRTEFNATVAGRLFERLYDNDGAYVEDRPVQGVRVQLSYDYEGSPHETLVDRTDANGRYVFVVNWTDLQPGDYDDAGDVDGGPSPGISAGEDGLLVDIEYSDVQVGGATLAFSAANETDYEVYSNPRGGENRLPDVFQSVP